MKHYTVGSQPQNEWIHPLCALFSNAFELTDLESMTFELLSTKDLGRRASKKQNCELCGGSQGSLNNCNYQDCKKHIHIYCGLWEKANNMVISHDMAAENMVEENPAEWSIRIFLEKNPAIKALSLKSNPYSKEELESFYRDFKQIENTINSKVEGTSVVIPKKKDKKQKKQIEEQKEEILESDEGFLAFLQAFEEKIRNDANLMMMTRKKEADNLMVDENQIVEGFQALRGGKLNIQCPEHKSPETYCICEPKNFIDNNDMMIACDYCDNWFHFNCVGLGNKNKEPNLPEIPYYICFQCQEWIKFKTKILRSCKKLLQTEECLLKNTKENLLEFELLPKNLNASRFRLGDMIFIFKVIVIKIQKILRNPPDDSAIESFLKHILDVLSMLPFKLPRKIEEIKKVKYLSFCLNFLLENNANKILSDLNIKSCLTNEGEFLPDKHSENLQNKKKISQLEEFFEQSSIDLKSKLFKQNKSLILLDWILDFHEIFPQNSDKKPSLEELSRLENKLKDFSEENYDGFNEFQFFRNKLKNFQEKKEEIQNKLFLNQKSGNKPEMSNEKEFKDFEEFLENTMKKHHELIVNRIPTSSLDVIHDEIQSLEFSWPGLLSIISEEKDKIEAWKQEFTELEVFNIKDIEGLIQKIDESFTQIPEMFDLLELYKEYKQWTHKYDCLMEKLRKEKVKIADLQELLIEKNKNNKKLDLSEKIASLQEKIKSYEDLRKKLQEILKKPMEINHWNRIKKDFATVFQELDLEEIHEFEEKLKVYKEISHTLTQQKKFSIKKLEEYKEKAKNMQLEMKLIKDLDSRLEKAENLKKEMDGILARKEFDFNDNSVISNLLLEIKTNKLEFDEISLLKSLLDSFDLLEKIHKIWLDNTNILESSEGKSLKNLISELNDTDKLAEKMPIIYQDLHNLLFSFKNVHILDENIQNLVQKYQILLWNYQAEQLLSQKSGQLINGETLEVLYLDSQNFLASVESENKTKIHELYATFKEIKAKLEEKLEFLEKSFETLQSIDNITNIFNPLFENLEIELSSAGFSFEEIKKKAQLLKTWWEWLQKASELMILMRENREVDYESSMKLLNLGQKLHFPMESSMLVDLRNLFSKANDYKEKISQYLQSKKKAFDSLKAAKSENANRKRYFELNRGKPIFSSLESLLGNIESDIKELPLLFSLLKTDITNIESDLTQAREFLKKFATFNKNYPLENMDSLKGFSSNELEVLKAEISNYRQESLWNIPVYIQEWDQEFSRLEMKFHGLSILAGNTANANLLFVRNYLKFAEDLKDETVWNAEYMKNVREVFNSTKELNQRIEEIKGLAEELQEENGANRHYLEKNFLNEKEMENILEKIKTCGINLNENKSFIENLVSKYRKSKDFYEKNQLNQATNPNKVLHLDFTRFFDETKVMPIEFPDYAFLEKQMQKYESLIRFLERCRKYLQNEQIPAKIAELLLEKYSICRIFVNEYEKLSEKFSKSNTLMEELERKLALFDDFLPQSFEEYQELNKKFDNIAIDFGERTLKVRVLLFKQKIHFLEEMCEKAKNPKGAIVSIPANKVSFKQLKHDLQYGYSLLLNDEIIEKLQVQIKWLEELLKELGDKFKEIESIKNVTVLEDYSTTYLEFIDISEELIEYKMALSYDKDEPISVDLGIKNFFQHYKEGIDCVSLLKSMGITPCTRGFVENAELLRLFSEEAPASQQQNNKRFAFLKEKIAVNNLSKEKNIKEKSKKEEDSNLNKKNLLGKRKINPTSFGNEFITNFNEDEEEESDLSEKPTKKAKKDIPLAQKPSLLKVLNLKEPVNKEIPVSKEKTYSTASKMVSSEKREEVLNKLEKFVKANIKFRKTNKNLKTFLTILENQIFGTYHNNLAKYENESGQLIKVFERLLKFPYISSNILSKNFRVEMMQKLTKNLDRLSQIENNLKSKDQEQVSTPHSNQQTKSGEQTAYKSSSLQANKEKTIKPLINSSSIQPKPIEKKIKIEQYDPFEKSLMKKQTPPPLAPKKEDPLKDLFSSKWKPVQSQQSQDKKPLSLLVLTEGSKAKGQLFDKNNENDKNKGSHHHQISKTKKGILEGYEALSSDEEKQKKTSKGENNNSSKKDEKKLEFSDEEIYEKNNKKRYSLENNSEDSFDNISKGSGAYDPLTENKKLEVEQPILFDPDNEEIPGISEKYSISIKTAPKGSILKIFEGRFRLNRDLVVNSNFLTIDDINIIVNNFPKIVIKEKSSLKLSGTTDYKTFSDFYFVRIFFYWESCLTFNFQRIFILIVNYIILMSNSSFDFYLL